MKISTNWLREFVTLRPPLEEVAGRLTMAGLEVKRVETRPEFKDVVYEVEITTNRPDWLSHWGVARELHAIENAGIKTPLLADLSRRPVPPGWKINSKAPDACPYYTACLLEGVQDGESPDWMKARLAACGIRSISLIVDITNYVLLEVGQPLHAFDADLLRGKEIQIRMAKAGEPIVAIDGTRYALAAEDLVISDHERAIAVAGVMGGAETEVGSRTRNILLESAFFHPAFVRRTSLRLGLASESSYRFERRVDPEGVDIGLQRAVHLYQELAGARNASAVLKAGRKPTLARSRIHVNLEQIEKILGVKMKPHQVHSILTRLGLEPKSENPANWVVQIPSYRADLERPVDVIEEIARIHGYENIEEALPERAPLERPSHPLYELEEKTRNFFAGVGFFETVTYSLINPRLYEKAGLEASGAVQIHNPIHQDLTLLRPSFLISLLEVAARNERVGERSVRIFELANLYSSPGRDEHPHEEKSLGILMSGEHPAGWKDAKREVSFFDLKGILESWLEFLGIAEVSFAAKERKDLKNSVDICAGKEALGYTGEIPHGLKEEWDLGSKVFYAEISLESLVKLLPAGRRLESIPRFPAVTRDISLVVSEDVTMEKVVREIRSLAKGWVSQVELFDLFQGGRIPKGQKSMAFRLTYQSLEKTLHSEEVQKLHQEIAGTLVRKFQASFQEKK